MRYPHLTEDENQLLNHVTMWGSDGYPLKKTGRKWGWSFNSINGPPVLYRSKKEAAASFEAYHALLLDRAAKRI